MRKRVKLSAQRIASCARIMQEFREAPVVVTTQVKDGTIGECIHRDGLREVMFIPLAYDGQHYRAMQVVRELRIKEEEAVL